MNQLIPFKKDITFKTKIADITSISLEHDIEIKNKSIFLNFIISGDYKMTEASINKESFEYNLPFEVDIDEKYDITGMNVDIDDFYYEIINNEVLRVNITILVDNLIVIKTDNEKLDEFSMNSENTIFDVDDSIEEIDIDRVNYNVNNNEIEPINSIENVNNSEIGNINNVKNINIGELEMKMYDNKNEIEDKIKNIENDNNTDIEENKMINSLFSNLSDEESYKTYHVYIVQEEDSLEKILEKYNVTKEILNEYNNMDNLKVGEKIIIPSIY